jgi:DNA polymerase III subunit alpha
MFERLDQVLSSAASMQKDKKAGQGGLFDDFSFSQPVASTGTTTPARTEWPHDELLGYEKELLGFYVSGHPLDSYRGHFDSVKLTKLGSLDEVDTSGKPVTVYVAGIVNKMEVRYSKKDNRPFATLVMEDFTGATEMMVWSDDYEKHKPLLVAGNVLGLRCRCSKDQRTEQNKLTLNDAKLLAPKKARRRSEEGIDGMDSGNPLQTEPARPAEIKPVVVRLNTSKHTPIDVERIFEVVTQHPGDVPFIIEFSTPEGQNIRMQAASEFRVTNSRELQNALIIWR